MSTFYLLPPSSLVAESLVGYLNAFLPGLPLARRIQESVAEALLSAATDQPEVYVVYREELPEGEDTAQALMEVFGAEAGDEVVEFRSGARLGETRIHRWRLGIAA